MSKILITESNVLSDKSDKNGHYIFIVESVKADFDAGTAYTIGHGITALKLPERGNPIPCRFGKRSSKVSGLGKLDVSSYIQSSPLHATHQLELSDTETFRLWKL